MLPGQHSVRGCDGPNLSSLLQAWVNDQYVVVGTKCNQLLCVDAASMRMCKIPLPRKPARPQELAATSSSQPGCGIHTVALSPDGSMLAVGGAAPTDCQTFHIQHHNGTYPTFTPAQCLVVCPAVIVHLPQGQLHEATTGLSEIATSLCCARDIKIGCLG